MDVDLHFGDAFVSEIGFKRVTVEIESKLISEIADLLSALKQRITIVKSTAPTTFTVRIGPPIGSDDKRPALQLFVEALSSMECGRMRSYTLLKHCKAVKGPAISSYDPFVSLLLYGGFLYLNEMYDVVAVNAFFFDEVDESRMDVKSVIHLGSPTSLDTDCMTRLKELDRFQPVTVQWLVDLGYSDFAWICPSEVLGDLVFPVDGGFAYRNKDKPEENCFVPVVPAKYGNVNADGKGKAPENLRFFWLDGDPLKDAHEKGSFLCNGLKVAPYDQASDCGSSPRFYFKITESTGRIVRCFVEDLEERNTWIEKLKSAAKREKERKLFEDPYTGIIDKTKAAEEVKHTGWVHKKGKINFKCKYFMLADGILKYFKNEPEQPLQSFEPRAMEEEGLLTINK